MLAIILSGIVSAVISIFDEAPTYLSIFALVGWSISLLMLIITIIYKRELSEIKDLFLTTQRQHKDFSDEMRSVLQHKTEEIKTLKTEKIFLMETIENHGKKRGNDKN
jgi:hypothetical protein